MKKETNVKEFLMKYGFVIILILVTAFFGITTNNFITVKTKCQRWNKPPRENCNFFSEFGFSVLT